jgi:opacity protein-like surface antigen
MGGRAVRRASAWAAIGGIVLASLAAPQAKAADMLGGGILGPLPNFPGAMTNWSGFYIGVHAGAAYGSWSMSDPYGAPIFGDTVHTPAAILGGQIGYNWQGEDTGWVLGIEADLSWVSGNGTNTCFAVTGMMTSSTCKAQTDFMGTLTGRVGYAAGLSGQHVAVSEGWRRGRAFDRRSRHQLRVRSLSGHHLEP